MFLTQRGINKTKSIANSCKNLFSPVLRLNNFLPKLQIIPQPLINQKRLFSDDSGFHDDFKTIRKKYENKDKQGTPYEEIEKYIKKEIESHPVVVFMKGIPEAPRCGFSGLAIRILHEEGVKNIRGINILEDSDLREGIKKFTNWPTIPQIFINKEFIGGSDVLKTLFETGELAEKLKNAGVQTV